MIDLGWYVDHFDSGGDAQAVVMGTFVLSLLLMILFGTWHTGALRSRDKLNEELPGVGMGTW